MSYADSSLIQWYLISRGLDISHKSQIDFNNYSIVYMDLSAHGAHLSIDVDQHCVTSLGQSDHERHQAVTLRILS